MAPISDFKAVETRKKKTDNLVNIDDNVRKNHNVRGIFKPSE